MKLIEAITMEDRFGPTRRNAPQLKHKIPFGLKDGALLHVLEVLNGKACGCVCPACSESLIAVNNVRKRIPHFRHSSGAECASGYETAIHMAAKDVLLRRLTLGLPEYSELLQLATSDNRHLQKNVYLPSKVITADRAYPEVSQAQGSFKPDVIFEVGDHQLFIEIRVTHAVDDEKKTKIRNHGVSVIEIDLSQLEPEMLQDRAAFDDVVCFDLLNRHWVFSQKIEQKRSKMMSQLREELEAYEEHLAEAIRLKVEEDKRAANRLKAEAAKRASFESFRDAEREKIVSELELLKACQKPKWIDARECELATRRGYSALTLYPEADQRRLFSNVRWGWVFTVGYRDWQAFVLDLIFPIRGKQTSFTANDIKRRVVSKFGVIPFVQTLNFLKQSHKQQGRDRGKSYGEYGSYLFSEQENKTVPTPYLPVVQYLDHLLALGVIQYAQAQREDLLCAAGPTASCIFQSQRQKEAEILEARQEQLERDQRAAEAARRQAEAERKIQAASYGERVYAIRASEQMAYEQHGGRGRRCNDCYLVSPPATKECTYCYAESLVDEEITEYRIAKNKNILRSSAKPAASINSKPSLRYESLKPIIEILIAQD